MIHSPPISDHRTALVPVEAWAYSSPGICLTGQSVDVGLLCEALLYYDRVLLNVPTQAQFAELLSWLVRTESFQLFLSLVRDDVVLLYDYSFLTAPVLVDGKYSLWNIQDPVQAQHGTFARRFFYRREVERALPKARQREALFRAFEGRVVEAKSDGFDAAIQNARADCLDPRRLTLVIQSFVDELYAARGLGRPPTLEATVRRTPDGAGNEIDWSTDLQSLVSLGGEKLGFNLGTPLAGAAVSNRLLATASRERCDLYLASPMSALVGDKLFECARTPVRACQVIQALKEGVEFPDVRTLVNQGQLSLRDVNAIRAKSQRFRSWLQSESDRDRDALLAYHHEVAKDTGFVKVARRSLSLFGVLAGGAVGGAVGSAMAGVTGGALGGAAGSALSYIADLGAALGSGWRPVVFGSWMEERIRATIDN